MLAVFTKETLVQPDIGTFFLGGVIDPATDERAEGSLTIEAADLTTHGVIVGMTGSGKTGLGVSLIEEALLSGTSCLVIDPKGDMGNLLLNFPDFRPEDFRPWIDETEAKRQGVTPDELATTTATDWREGLASWDVSPDRMRELQKVVKTIYTPGSSAGVPLDILGSLTAPDKPFADDPETHRNEIEAYVQSLLTLAGVTSDPVSGREHILTATIIEQAWSEDRDMDLATLIGAVQTPPFRKLGVFDIDAFFPKKDRTELAMRLNGLMASPSFAEWLKGEPLDIDRILFGEGVPKAAIVTISHLSDPERQFVVTLLLSKLVTWMRRQSGTSDLRALVYMDEVFGFAPPTAEPPSKKPILTIFKQARAFGVGMVLSTQNPVDLDYKTMSNAGTWLIGRLQTERDKARILEGLATASGDVDVARYDTLISDLDKRQFVMSTAKADEPSVFATRWAMSYLAGPLTRDEIARLTPDRADDPASVETPVVAAPTANPENLLKVSPTVADGVSVSWVDPAAGWIASVGGNPASTELEAAAVATVNLFYDDRASGVDHRQTYEAIIHPLTQMLDGENVHPVDHDPRDFISTAPADASYRLPDAPIDRKSFWTSLDSALDAHLVAEARMTVFTCPPLKTYSRVGETRHAFVDRCLLTADQSRDTEIAGLTDRYRARIDRVKDRISTAERRVSELDVDVDTRKQGELLSGAGDLLGAILGGRRSGAAISRVANRRGQTKRTEERLETAQARVENETTELASLEGELADEIADITDRWAGVDNLIEEVEIGLEKTDITLASLGLVWLPIDR